MKIFKLLPILTLGLVMASCSSVKVVVDVDKNADFSNYETYSFLGWEYDSDEILNEFDRKRIRDAFKNESDRRGLKAVEAKGDMEISLYVVLDEKTTITRYNDYYGGHYGGYGRYGGGWGYGYGRMGYSYGSATYQESDYMVGTLVMDVFDGESKKQVWQGIVTGVVTENPAKRDKTIPAKIKSLMRKFPVQPK